MGIRDLCEEIIIDKICEQDNLSTGEITDLVRKDPRWTYQESRGNLFYRIKGILEHLSYFGHITSTQVRHHWVHSAN